MSQARSIPPFYISNDGEETLAALLAAAVRRLEERRLDVAVGYFKPDVWGLIGDAFKELETFRLLLGTEPQVEGDPAGLDLADYYQRAIRGELEELVFDRAHAALIDDLIDFLRRECVDVRLYHGQPRENARFLHAKAYIFPTLSVVGSSNLTPAGLTTNAELNLVRTDREAADELRKWFESRWTPSMPYKDELIRVLEESKFGDKQWTPYQVFIKALYEYFKDRLGPEEAMPVAGEPLDLAVFQWEGVREATALLDRYRGCVVADATGLGKTFIGLELMRQYFLRLAERVKRPRFLLIVPAQLKSLIWDPLVAEHLGFRVDVVSMESLGRDDFDTRRYIEYDFILVDEGHNFRNPATRRYENLLAILGTGKQDKYVVLMTATPINTSVYDMLHQILLVTRNRHDYYAVDGIASLEGYFRRVAKEGAGMLDVIQVSTVRRTRYDLRKRQERGERIMIKDEEVHFPQQPPPEPILYDLTASYGGFYEEGVEHIESLRLAPYRLETYRREKTPEVLKELQRQEALVGIFKTTFLKRLESSAEAFRASIHDQAQFQDAFLKHLRDKGKLLGAAEFRRIRQLLKNEDDDRLARVEDVLDSLDEVNPEAYDIEALKGDVDADVTALNTILGALDELTAQGTADAKLDKVKEFVRARLNGKLQARKLLIFSYFRETAEYLHKSLKADTQWLRELGDPRIEIITGDTDGDRRSRIVREFAPISNRPEGEEAEGWEPLADQVDILVSTDVLSEGQNLQDCGELINYDLHWNPVRMIQRAGRINRLKTLHDPVFVYNCFPEKELEELLRIVERLHRRIRDIDQSVGLDASVMGETISDKSFEQLQRIRERDATVVDELEQQAELVTTEDMKLPLQMFIKQVGEEELKKIPLGIRSAREGATKGTFLAFKAPAAEREFHYWRFYPEDGSPAVADMREIFQIIDCDSQEPRVSVPDPDNPEREDRRFDVVERATADILKELKGQRGAATRPYPMIRIEREYYDAIANPLLGEPIEAEVRERVMHALETGAFRGLHKKFEWRELRRTWRSQENGTSWLASELDKLAVTWGLYSDASFGPVGALKVIQEQKLKLVCYELVM